MGEIIPFEEARKKRDPNKNGSQRLLYNAGRPLGIRARLGLVGSDEYRNQEPHKIRMRGLVVLGIATLLNVAGAVAVEKITEDSSAKIATENVDKTAEIQDCGNFSEIKRAVDLEAKNNAFAVETMPRINRGTCVNGSIAEIRKIDPDFINQSSQSVLAVESQKVMDDQLIMTNS